MKKMICMTPACTT